MSFFPTGSLIELQSFSDKSFVLVLLVECKGNASSDTYLFSKWNKPFERLHISQNGIVTYTSISQNKNMLFNINKVEESIYHISSVVFKSLYLSLSIHGLIGISSSEMDIENNALFRIRLIHSNPTFQINNSNITVDNTSCVMSHIGVSPNNNTMKECVLDNSLCKENSGNGNTLSSEQKAFFRRHGYLLIPQVIDHVVTNNRNNNNNNNTKRTHYINEVLYKLFHELGVPGSVHPGGNQLDQSLGKLGGSVSNAKEIRRLIEPWYGTNISPDYFKTHALRMILGEILGGADNIPPASQLGAQIGIFIYNVINIWVCNINTLIAIRFPEQYYGLESQHEYWMYDTVSSVGEGVSQYPPISRHQWHVDGLRQGSRHSFSVLLGICCSKVSAEYCGNLIIWPGSHHIIHP